MHTKLQTAIDAARQCILDSAANSEDIRVLEDLIWRLRAMQSRYPAAR